MSDDERQAFAVPFAEGEYDDVELSLLDRDDEDDRRLLILAEAMCDSNAHLGGMSRIRRHGRS